MRGGVFSKNIWEGASERATKWKYNSVRDPKNILNNFARYYSYIGVVLQWKYRSKSNLFEKTTKNALPTIRLKKKLKYENRNDALIMATHFLSFNKRQLTFTVMLKDAKRRQLLAIRKIWIRKFFKYLFFFNCGFCVS